jgi:DNA-binding transcriptional MerR regulator
MSPRKSTANADSSARSDGRVATEASNSDASLSIGELARRTGVSTRTIRYYEELGILPSPQRTDGGTRRYPREYIFYVEGARTLKELGFGLEEIAELGKFALTGQWDSGRSQSILTRKLAELEHRIRVLNRLHDLVVEASKSSSRASGKGKGKNKADVPPLLRWVGEDRRDEEAAAGTK